MARLPPLNWLRAFEASARALSFTSAAEELNMTQSAVSQQIKSLESALGRSLFLRRARGLELTDEGRGYLPTVQAAFAMLEEGTTVLQGRNDPDVLELQVNLSFALFWLTPRLGQFMEENPSVQLNLATSVWSEERPNHAASMQIVFGLGKKEGIAGKRLTRDTLFPVCSPKLARQIKSLDDLLAQRLFDLPGTAQSWGAWLKAHPQGHSLEVPAVHRASTWALSLEWAQRDLGVALAHETIVNDLLASGQLVRPFAFSIPLKESYYLIAPEGMRTRHASKVFKDWLLREMAVFQSVPG
ncbi:LysR family transcriptional regulator [Rhodoferax sp. GW822-FHT02A01]|uniref:LysR family transcriptional regulator n=1 Tax=Rhodoferax sp. GW822-FHT02A01 TaxID=3141537 RepID=UPI00315DA218